MSSTEDANDNLPPLPRPAVTYADHSFPAFSRAQMMAYAEAAMLAASPAPVVTEEMVERAARAFIRGQCDPETCDSAWIASYVEDNWRVESERIRAALSAAPEVKGERG